MGPNTANYWNATIPFSWVSGDTLSWHYTVPIVGWTAQDYLGKMLTGFATAKVGQAGLVNNDSSNTGGTPIKGRTNGTAVPAGYVGEVLTTGQQTITSTTGNSTVTSLSLPAGCWDVSAMLYAASGGGSQTGVWAGLSTVTNSQTGWVVGVNAGAAVIKAADTASQPASITIMPNRYNTSGETVYLVVQANTQGNTVWGCIRAVRVA
jgi:hypothetical protein